MLVFEVTDKDLLVVNSNVNIGIGSLNNKSFVGNKNAEKFYIVKYGINSKVKAAVDFKVKKAINIYISSFYKINSDNKLKIN